MKKIFLLLLISITVTKAAVWQAKPGLHWDPYWEDKYQQWIQKEVEGDFFKKLGGPYYDLPLDCADAAYALRIYFSFKHQLPWKASSSQWRSFKGELSNEMTRFNSVQSGDERVAALINFILDQVGTHSLAEIDSYSVALDNIKPGDLFLYRYCKNNSCTRHAYIIKDINADGTFDVLFGTQNRAKKKWLLGRKKKEYLQHKPDVKDWGFKRFKFDRDIGTPSGRILENNYEQYEIAKRLTEDQFFDYVNASVRVIIETPTKKITRLANSICYALQSRKVVVEDAVKYMAEEGAQCMNEATFDIYSTPSRDTGIYKQYRKLETYINNLGPDKKVNAWMLDLAQGIFTPRRSQTNEKRQNQFCNITISDGRMSRSVNLASFYQQLIRREVSYHPNDNLFWRWGVPVGQRTQCHTWYTSELD